MVLDKTSCELLMYLLDQESPKTIMTISKDLGQSRRKVYYLVDKINDALGNPEQRTHHCRKTDGINRSFAEHRFE